MQPQFTIGLGALIATAAVTAASAADITVTDARISGGKLVVTGTTATPNTWVRLDGQIGGDFNQKSGADGAFAFGIVYHPGDCIVDLQKLVSPTTLGISTVALVADCGPAGVSPRGAWTRTADYITNDLVTYRGSTWRARRENSQKQPAEGADWEIFAAGATALSQQAAASTQDAGGASGGVQPMDSPTGPAGGDLTGNYPNPQIAAGAVGTTEIQDASVNGVKINDNSVRSSEIRDDTLADGGLAAVDLAPDSVGASEIIADSVGSSEIAPNIVGADELETVHEHFGTATNITDVTAHDGAYSTGSATVSCGAGEDLLSVSVDWTVSGGHNELVFSGVNVINRGEPDSATVRVAFDGGPVNATFQPVATCIF